MKDVIVVTTFGGLHVFRCTTNRITHYLNDTTVLEVMDAQTGEMYKYAPGVSYIGALWAEVSNLLEGGAEDVQ